MRHFQASAVERRIEVTESFESHPMEVGWASEAIFFLIVERVPENGTSMSAVVELSADGINWIPEGTQFEEISSPGHYFAKVRHFGNWLRVRGKINDATSSFKLSVHLHLK